MQKVIGRNILTYLSGMGAFEMMGRKIIERMGLIQTQKRMVV
jgi:uncharacterized membrane protein YcaP (DUF421 family)